MRPVKILCFVRYWTRHATGIRTRVDAVMLKAFRADDFIVENVFDREMPKRIRRWNEDHVGDRPRAYCLLGYLTERGEFRRLNGLETRIR